MPSPHHSNPSDANVGATLAAYERIYEQYASSNRLLNDDVRRSLDRFVAYAPGSSVLDVGCAGGRETAYLASRGLTATGCDLTPAFVELARKAYPQCDFFVADMRHLKGQETYDGIWCSAAFLHIPKHDALLTLQGFHRLLKAGGILYLSVMQGTFEGLRENKQMDWPARHFSEYQPDELDELTSQVGFTKLSASSIHTDWGPTFLHSFYRKA